MGSELSCHFETLPYHKNVKQVLWKFGFIAFKKYIRYSVTISLVPEVCSKGVSWKKYLVM